MVAETWPCWHHSLPGAAQREFKDRQYMASTHKRHETAESFNLLNFIPAEEMVDPMHHVAIRQQKINFLLTEG